jgi:hypothetical protein
MSPLDSFIAGSNDGPEFPLGEGGERLFAWLRSGGLLHRLTRIAECNPHPMLLAAL